MCKKLGRAVTLTLILISSYRGDILSSYHRIGYDFFLLIIMIGDDYPFSLTLNMFYHIQSLHNENDDYWIMHD